MENEDEQRVENRVDDRADQVTQHGKFRASMEIDNELEAYEDVLLTAEYIAEIYERNDMPEDAEAYRTLCSKDDVH